MKALLLVGGFGTRLRPLTVSTPKQLLPIAGKPMIEWVVERLVNHGVDELILSLGYKSDAFLDAYPTGKILGLPFKIAIEPEPRGTAGAIRFCAETVELDETFLVLNGDVLTDLDTSSLLAFHRRSGGLATIAMQTVENPSRYGVISTSDTGQVMDFVEKPAPGTEPSNNINAGTYVMEPGVLESIPTNTVVSIERETFPQLAADGELYAMSADSYWLDTGTPEQFLEANIDVLRSSSTLETDNAMNCSVSDTAIVIESILGRDSELQAGVSVNSSVLFSQCTIERDASVTRSILADNVRVGEGSILEDCVVAPHAVIPKNAYLKNKKVAK
ncbi:MAG: NDP-sugar synthase [Actinomycetota bacterium]|nr:NDP-sugar synthase [Actinomycetota bacterium]